MTRRWVILFAATAMIAAACSSAVDNTAEQIVEKAIESQGQGNVDVELNDDGGVSLSVEGEDGSSMNFGNDVPLPDGLTIPIPAGGKATASGSDGSRIFASITYADDRYDEFVSFYDDWTNGTGEEWTRGESSLDVGGQTLRTTMWNQGDSQISIADCFSMDGDTDSLDATCVSVGESP